MKENEFCVDLIKRITEALLDYTKSQSEVMKIITIGVQAAIKKQNKKEKP